MTNKTYDIMKWVAQYVLPGLATLYFALSGIWHLPYTEQIVGTIMALDAFLGLLLGLSATSYKSIQKMGTYVSDETLSHSIEQPSTATRRTGIIIKMKPATYDVLIWITQYLTPALGTLVFGLSAIWGFSWGTQIVGTLAAINVFMGVILGISTAQYNTEMSIHKSLDIQAPL